MIHLQMNSQTLPIRTIQKIMTRQTTMQTARILIQEIVIHRIMQNHMKVMNG